MPRTNLTRSRSTAPSTRQMRETSRGLAAQAALASRRSARVDDAPAKSSLPARIVLQRADEPGKKWTKFTTGEWSSDVPVNATVYVANDQALNVRSITVVIER